MGCISQKGIRRSASKIQSVNDLIISPGIFVTANERKFRQVYKLGRLLGTGGYGQVRRASHKQTQALRAVKIFRKDLIRNQESKQKMIEEINFMKTLDHHNIVRVFEYFQDTKDIYMVMQHCKGGELFEQIQKRQSFQQFQAASIMKQLFSAVGYLHEKGIIHRDLKPENILLEQTKKDEFLIKLIDFGTATRLKKDSTVRGTQGTAYYVAPEVLSGSYNQKCDSWSCGVILFILLCGYPPFDGANDQEVVQSVKRGKYSLKGRAWNYVSEDAKDLISRLLCPATVRLSAFDAMNHPWILANNSQRRVTGEALQGILTNLRDFSSRSKLRDAVHTFIATQLLSDSDIKELREAFKTIDTNSDGKLSREELMMHYTKIMGEVQAGIEVDRIMREVDTDQSGFIDYTEFIKAAINSQKILSQEHLKMAFQMFDRDGSGTISAEELKKVLQGDMRSSDAVWDELVREVDQNGDGEIDLKEFQDLILSRA